MITVDIPVIFFVFIFLYIVSLIHNFFKRLKKGKEPIVNPDCPYQQTSFLDFPIFSINRGINPTDPSLDLLALSGGGGGAEYGVPNRLELYTRDPTNRKKTENGFSRNVSVIDMMSSKLMLGVVDDIRFNPLRNIFVGGCRRDCVIFRVNPITKCSEVVYEWETVPSPLPGARDVKVQERCAISPDGTLVATVGEDKVLHIYFLLYDENGIVYDHRPITSITELIKGGCTDLTFTPDNNLLLCVCRDGNIHVIGPFDPSLLPSGNEQTDQQMPEFKLITSIRIPIPSGIPAPKFSGPNPSITPRNLQWLGTQSGSTVANGHYLCAVTGHVTNGNVSFLYKLEIFSRIAAPGVQGEPTVQWKEINHITKKGCPMLNCLAISDDNRNIAVVSNTRLYVYDASSLRNKLDVQRTVATETDMPATGCVFVNGGRELVITGGDFSLTTINLSAAAAAQGSSLLWGIFSLVGFFFRMFLIIMLSAIAAVCISGLRKGLLAPKGSIDFQSLQHQQLSQLSSEIIMPSQSRHHKPTPPSYESNIAATLNEARTAQPTTTTTSPPTTTLSMHDESFVRHPTTTSSPISTPQMIHSTTHRLYVPLTTTTRPSEQLTNSKGQMRDHHHVAGDESYSGRDEL